LCAADLATSRFQTRLHSNDQTAVPSFSFIGTDLAVTIAARKFVRLSVFMKPFSAGEKPFNKAKKAKKVQHFQTNTISMCAYVFTATKYMLFKMFNII